MPVPPKVDPEKTCETCGVTMVRRRFGARLEDRTRFLSRRFCSKRCASTRAAVTKDALHWRARKHRASACSECSTTTSLHVHHIDRNPANNDPANLLTHVCRGMKPELVGDPVLRLIGSMVERPGGRQDRALDLEACEGEKQPVAAHIAPGKRAEEKAGAGCDDDGEGFHGNSVVKRRATRISRR